MKRKRAIILYLVIKLILLCSCCKETYIKRPQKIVFCLDNAASFKKLIHKNLEILATLQNIFFKNSKLECSNEFSIFSFYADFLFVYIICCVMSTLLKLNT